MILHKPERKCNNMSVKLYICSFMNELWFIWYHFIAWLILLIALVLYKVRGAQSDRFRRSPYLGLPVGRPEVNLPLPTSPSCTSEWETFPGSSSQTRIRAPTPTRLIDPQSHTVTWYNWRMSPLQFFGCGRPVPPPPRCHPGRLPMSPIPKSAAVFLVGPLVN
jgi:hypothetical protein